MPENYVLLERTELNAAAASVTFANIPQSGYTDLKIVMSARDSSASTRVIPRLTFNGSTTGYSSKALYGVNGSTTGSDSGGSTYIDWSYITGDTATASTFSNTEVYIPNYLSSNNKSVSIDFSAETNSASSGILGLAAGLWSNTAAITSITFTATANFLANSTFSLYGIAALGTTPTIAPKAYGGNRIDNDGTYWYHTFTSSGSFVPQVGLTCDAILVAGGGGGGGGAIGGGGGAGGFRALTSQSVSVTSYTITVGAGGTAAVSQTNGTQGVDSSFNSLTSTGGGYGAGGNAGAAGGSGGSGGGAAYTGTTGGTGNTPSTSPAQGTNGNGSGSANFGGGGGGASAAATNQNGGAGNNTYSAWATATSTGVSGYYAGGGGGGSRNGTAGGTGGAGGGGAGSTGDGNGSAGTTNTGSGGGGAGYTASTTNNGGAGGSGIVIIRYTIA
jgi:hypothetical protein